MCVADFIIERFVSSARGMVGSQPHRKTPVISVCTPCAGKRKRFALSCYAPVFSKLDDELVRVFVDLLQVIFRGCQGVVIVILPVCRVIRTAPMPCLSAGQIFQTHHLPGCIRKGSVAMHSQMYNPYFLIVFSFYDSIPFQ